MDTSMFRLLQLNLSVSDGASVGAGSAGLSSFVVSLPPEILSLAQLYLSRVNSKNCFDELNNQWGWGGFLLLRISPVIVW